MAPRFTLPHIDISGFRTSSPYQGSGSAINGAVRDRQEHGRRLQNELNAALVAADATRPIDGRLPPAKGTYLEVELQRGAKPDILIRKGDGIRPGAVKADENNVRTVALYVPDTARAALLQILNDYTSGPLTRKGKPQRGDKIGPIEAFRRARLETVWTDSPSSLPDDPQKEMWWAVWCTPGAEARIEDACERLGVRAAVQDRRSYFPEATVIPVLATRVAIELMLFITGDIDELRRASDNPVFYTDEVRGDQAEWTENLAERITWPDSTAPAVCLLDTGVNRAHALIEPALASSDMHAIHRAWEVNDHGGHGTAMAGLALHGDLTVPLGDKSERILKHRIESVKFLPPDGFDPNEPHSYGVLTQSAISLPQISAPERSRIFCMAVSNVDVSGAIASTWSAAIDQIAAGTMIGDDDDAPRRLFILSIGNVPPLIQTSQLQPQDNYPAEDPAQAWNALTIGGYTDLVDIHDSGYEDWAPMVGAGELSPHSRTSVTWPQGRAPFKPELVLEAGNRAVSPAHTEVLTIDSLSLLSTGHNVDTLPLVPFEATSAATAQAARMAAMLHAEHPKLWPETVRGLLVHSAEWTNAMLTAFSSTSGKRDNYGMVRRFGYGVPDFNRANASAQNHLALIAQTEIQPFKKEERKFNECHYFSLPLPASILEELGNTQIQLKITLSYFVDPNPGLSANVDPQRYQSFGLRFDLRRKGETITNFKKRVNAAERENPRGAGPGGPDDSGWLLGPKSVAAGSLHCDVWTGPAIDLLGRDQICISPVNGWWRNRASLETCNKQSRYSLIVTIKTNDNNIDIYTPIKTFIEINSRDVEVEI